MDKNPFLQIEITTAESENPCVLEEIKLEISGPNLEQNIARIDALFAEKNKVFGHVDKIDSTKTSAVFYTIAGNEKLREGKNIFKLYVQLTGDADLHDWLKVESSILIISGKEHHLKTTANKQKNYFGIALRKHLEGGVDTYRIPGLATTNKGTLIAVYDIRRNSSTDLQEDIDVGMSRSADGGRSWGPMQVIMDMGEWGKKPNNENGIGDPSVLVDRLTNTIWVAAVWAHGHPGERNWFASKPGLIPQETSQLMLVKSEDDGITWSDPINITSQVKNPKWHLLLQGPGKGISMNDGTLVFAAQYKDENEVPHSTIIWSKDRGKTWHIGKGAKTHTTEAQVIELNNGDLMLNMRDDRNRNNSSNSNGRAVYVTSDLGETWREHPTSNHVLPEPNCMGSLIKEEFEIDGKKRKLVLFSNPNSKIRRDSLTIKVSFDDGTTWPLEHRLLLDEKEGRGYSCMTKIDNKHLGILYEGSSADMTFQIIPVKDIIIQNQKLTYLFESGSDGYATYRIPAIVKANNGTLLAFAEGRVNGSSDTGDIDLVMKSSADGGKTWSPLYVLWNDSSNTCGNPAPVVDQKTGSIHLLMTWNLGEDHEREIIDMKSKDTRRVFVSSSSDNGETWSEPQEITGTVKAKNWTWYATGPGHGIQLKHGAQKGRLLIPCDHIEAQTKHYYSHVIYSDDNGQNWRLGGSTPQDQVNECMTAELPDGRVLLNMRNYDRSKKTRKISWSGDGGISWSDLQHDPALIEPICQAGLLFTQEDESLWFLNPSSTTSRRNMTLKRSRDLGESWTTYEVLYSGMSAYSDLCQIETNKLGCLFEAGITSAYEGIVFTIVNTKN